MNNIFDNAKVREEAGIYLSSLDIVEKEEKDAINTFLEVATIINNSENTEGALMLLQKYYRKGILSRLTLEDNEFEKEYHDGVKRNKRFPYIVKDIQDNIIYNEAITPVLTHIYNKDTNEEVNIFPDYLDHVFDYARPIWITRGGCCTGEYIASIRLKQSTIAKHSFYPHSPILVPITMEVGERFIRYSVDAREPKLRAVREYYDTVEVKIDYKFDIRKYKKLNKNGTSKR